MGFAAPRLASISGSSARFPAAGSAGGMFSARIKMGQTSPVNCYVKAGGKVYKTSQEIKVTVGGCGG